MWTHTRMSFPSHTFTSLQLVHTLNPDLLGWQLWLCFSLIREFPVQDFRSSWLCRFEILDFRMFMIPMIHRFKIPENRMFVTPRLRGPKIPENRLFVTLRLRRPKIPENRMSLAPEKHISRTFLNSTFWAWQVFLNSPTIAPQGSGLTPTIRFHEHFGNLVKNVTLGTSEGTRVTRKPYNGLIEACFAELPPSPL
jgi:hypothetical protein